MDVIRAPRVNIELSFLQSNFRLLTPLCFVPFVILPARWLTPEDVERLSVLGGSAR